MTPIVRLLKMAEDLAKDFVRSSSGGGTENVNSLASEKKTSVSSSASNVNLH